jgi:circadian clock protein KaiC
MVAAVGSEVALTKSPTGILGLDAVTHGGLPHGRCTLVEGGPGSGKSVLALQTLVYGARVLGEPGIFVAFEEEAERIVANASSFGWNLPALQGQNLFFLDAQPSHALVLSGGFDLGGLLAALDAKIAEMGATRIVFDALDVVLSLFDDIGAARREIHRLHAWMNAHQLTTIITSKADPAGGWRQAAGFTQFMVDCAITLEHRTIDGVSQRRLQVVKYRGSDFDENETPMIIGPNGIDVAYIEASLRAPVTEERVSTGVERLDTMLGGGYYRGASVLITGSPGTAKTTLCAAFCEAACLRSEPTLYVSFDSAAPELIRNVASVGIRLERFIGEGPGTRGRGLLRIIYARALSGSAETHLMAIRQAAREHRARCVVVDPISALGKGGNLHSGQGVVERLIDWAKTEGITVVCTSLLDESMPETEGTPMQVSTIADTWIHLSYTVRSGERNRGLTIVKSRGTAHSNQVRELVLGNGQITLADAYTSGGDVLMGTLRWEREQADAAARRGSERAREQVRLELAAEEADLLARLSSLQHLLEAKRARMVALEQDVDDARVAEVQEQAERLMRRHADQPGRKAVKSAPG